MKLAEVSLQAFNKAIQAVSPTECVRKCLQLDGNWLTVQGRTYELNHNVHIVAIGKAAVGMVEGAEAALGDHAGDGIASVPVGSRVPDGLKTKFYTGAEHNLPDAAAVENARRIEQFLERVRAADQIVLFLISGGGSALLPAPVPGISLEEKLDVIKLLAQNGADIKQLNIARIALSRLKGGKLAKKAAPSKCISLIMSDIVGDPIDLISSGPTVLSRTDKRTPLDVLRELKLVEKVPRKILDVFEASGSHSKGGKEESDPAPNVHNVIVCNNRALLASMSKSFKTSNLPAHIVTSELSGDATELGTAFADLIRASMTRTRVDATALTKLLAVSGISVQPLIPEGKRIVMLFGGESTVRFDAASVSDDAKGGRNQEMTLAAFLRLLEPHQQHPGMPGGVQFAFLSLGSDGQDGPTDATGAFVTSDDITCSDAEEIKLSLSGKNSYGFWSTYNGGSNLVKTGKTGVNLMDVQIVYISFS